MQLGSHIGSSKGKILRAKQAFGRQAIESCTMHCWEQHLACVQALDGIAVLQNLGCVPPELDRIQQAGAFGLDWVHLAEGFDGASSIAKADLPVPQRVPQRFGLGGEF